MICLFILSYWLYLRYKISSILTVIIGPAMHFRNFSNPVSVTRTNWSSPFQCGCTPWILSDYPSSFEYGVEEIKHKQQLHSKHYSSYDSDESVQPTKLVE